MSDLPNHGGSAFPALAIGPSGDVVGEWGMTLRDWFASNERIAEDTVTQQLAVALMGSKVPGPLLDAVKWWAEAESRYKYLRADAMIRARGTA